MNIGNQRYVYAFADFFERRDAFGIGQRNAYYVAARIDKTFDLSDRQIDVFHRNVRHRLYGYRRSAAYN